MLKKNLLLLFVSLMLALTATGCDIDISELESTEETPYADESLTRHKVGETFESEDYLISYISAERCDVIDSEYTAEDGYVYYKLQFEFENISDKERNVFYGSFACYADGVITEQLYAAEGVIRGTLVEKGMKAEGCVVFIVPENAEKLEVVYQYDIWTEEKIVFTID